MHKMSKRKSKDISCISQRTFRRRIAKDFNAALQEDDNSSDEDLATHLPNTSHHEPAVVPNSHQDPFINESDTIGRNTSISTNFTESVDYNYSTLDVSHRLISDNLQNSTSTDSSFLEDKNNYIHLDNSNSESASFDEKLKTWAIKYKIKLNALDGLLVILRDEECGKFLPKDSRTLLKTPRTSLIKSVEPGHYCHFGVRVGLREAMQKEIVSFSSCNNSNIGLKISTDGLPLSDSSNSQLWPILGCLAGSSYIFVIGVYHGLTKPNDSNIFFQDFVSEMIDIFNNGFLFNDTLFKVYIHSIICDAPAKSFLVKIKGHTGYFSCTKCTQEGEFLNGRICFPETTNIILRTDEAFLRHEYEDFHQGQSILLQIPNFKQPITRLCLDYMHLICIGVLKKIIKLWLEGKPDCSFVRLPHAKILLLTAKLLSIRHHITNDFARKPQNIEFLSKWKATELRQFLLYTCPVIIKDILHPQVVDHIMTLHVAVRILCNKSLLQKYSDYAQALLQHFIDTFIILYGKQFVSHNVHGLLHIVNDAKLLGTLDEFSAFPFENKLRLLKRQLRKSDRPLQQLHRRYIEESNNIINPVDPLLVNEYTKKHSDGPVIDNSDVDKQYRKAKIKNICVQITSPDNYYLLNNKSIIVVSNIVFDKVLECMTVLGKKYLKYTDIYKTPCNSSIIDCWIVEDLECDLESWPILEIKYKCLALPIYAGSNKLAVFPILHGDCSQM